MLTRVPKYRLHKSTGQALVEIRGKRIYLGKHGSPESQQRYRQLIAELLSPAETLPVTSSRDSDLTINELVLRYFQYAKTYYTKNGKPTDEIDALRAALRRLRQFCGESQAKDFGPKSFKRLREELVREQLSRKYINDSMTRIRRMFRWGVAEELLPPSVHQALMAVPGLRKGRSEARETKPILPVDDATVEATLPHLTQVVADLVRFQRLTGCRPTEACIVRPGDIQRDGDVWLYRPASHKTEHHGRDRVILIGPQAQHVLQAYMLRNPESYCFSPLESEKARRGKLHSQRKTPEKYGNFLGSNRKRSPKTSPGDRYNKDSYNRAIKRACKKAGISAWSPNQLRHARATEIRSQYGLEAAQVMLGHSNANVTQIYAERDLEKALIVAAALG